MRATAAATPASACADSSPRPWADASCTRRNVHSIQNCLSSEQKAVNRAAEEKMALMEMMNKLNEDVAAKDELVEQLKQQIAAGGGGAGSDSDKDKKIEELEAKFIAEATAGGMVGLKGHRSVGGCRASIYNAMEPEGVAALASFMERFQNDNG